MQVSSILAGSIALTALAFTAHAQTQHHGHGGSAAMAAALSSPERNMGGYKVRVVPIDPSRTQVGITVRNRLNAVLPPNAVPLKVEYVAQNVPFTALPVTVSDSQLVGQVPLVNVPYTIRVTLVLDGTKHEQRFFIAQPIQKTSK
jgi:hypothetical protein